MTARPNGSPEFGDSASPLRRAAGDAPPMSAGVPVRSMTVLPGHAGLPTKWHAPAPATADRDATRENA